ncbi:hypothetical protein BLNAU_11049 [Blattamonas nauphoetae]|uniref:Protein kinase domain-containing protein n=1 Tax=Blattamonas nauphoetae TaxID=2049346 RepID=A0ABQ9XNG1_9EUKA|nr:hypothetical protein BLNAU_11049 [Blattamonas nauphoetae]
MTGNETRIRFWDDRSGMKETRKLDGNVVGIETMFVFMNSSVYLSSLELDCGMEGVGTARVLGSNVVVSLCSIRSNMECSPFVVCWMGETDRSSITVTSSSHVSSCSPSLLPLVEICDDSIRSGRTASHERLGRKDTTDNNDGWTPSVSITGSSIEFGDGDLILGTGPLIGSLDRIGNEVERKSVSTSLVGCVLVNMTSPYEAEGSKVGSWFGQSIVGSVVSSCSNHLYGTSIRSLNGGGSLLSLNTSFTTCLATTKHENKPFYATVTLTTATSPITFTRCTFKDCEGYSQSGGAIFCHAQNVKVHIESCSFDSCTALRFGGGIHIYFGASSPSFTLKSSLFKSCSSQCDASLSVEHACKTTISECVFLDSKVESYGGAVGIAHWDPATQGGAISNCLIQNGGIKDGHGTYMSGGGMYIQYCLSIRLSSLVFKDCSAGTGEGHDIYFYGTPLPTLDLSTISNCVSKSKHPTSLIYVHNNQHSEDRSDLINKSPAKIALTALTADVNGVTADVQATVDKEISGTLLVVVSNVKGTRKEVTGGIPNIGRVLEFSIPSSSSIGSCSVSIGETGLLQTPLSDYSIVAVFHPGHIVSFTKFQIFEPSVMTTLLSASCSLDASHTEATVHFEGRDFEDGKYDVSLDDGSLSNVQFSKGVDGKWIGSKELGVIGPDSDWTEGGTWIVKEVKSVSKPTQSIKIDDPVSFTIPTVARLSQIKVSELDASTKGKVTLSFSSVELEKGVEYTLTLVGQDSAKETLTRTMNTTSSGEIEELEEVLYPFKTDPAEQMKFGVLYKVTSLKATGRSNSVQFGLVGVQMPVEPVRLTHIEVTDKAETSIKLKVTGSGFVLSETYTVEVSGVLTEDGSSNGHTQTFTVVASGTTSATSSTLVLSNSDPTSLQFGQTYTVTKIEDATKEGIVVGTPSFATSELSVIPPTAARITDTSVELNSQGILLSVVLIGEHLPSDSTFDLTLNSTITLKVSFNSSTKGKSEVVLLGLDGGLDFGSTYSITDLSNGENVIAADGVSVSTPQKLSELTICVCSDDPADASIIRSGADVSTCLRIERAWSLASRLSIHNTMMRIVEPASLSTPLLVSPLPFQLTSGRMGPSLLCLSQPSSMTNSDSSLLSITDGECGLTLLTITTSSSSSFVFISAQSSTITIQTCSIEGSSSTQSNSEGSICGWKTGFLHFVDSKANLSAVTLKGLGSGGIVQKGGELTISKGEFSDNGQTNSSFPSARQNIHCEGEGKLTIDSLSKGDGTKNSPSAWIDADDCPIDGDQDIVSSPLFVPTLDSDTSSTNFEKKTNTMHFTVKGEMLVPCGLDVEVFEWDSSKSVKGESALLHLDSLATTKWTSTEIVGQVDLKTSFLSLNSSFEWRARLVFGNNRTTANSFLFASASSTGKGNMSQGGVSSHLVWIIPVVVCVLLALILLIILIVLIARRNKKKKNEQSLMMNEERSAMEMGEVIVKEEEDVHDSTLNRVLNGEASIQSQTRQHILSKGDSENRTFSDDAFCPPLDSAVRDIPESMQREAIQCVHPFETKVVSCADSLYCRLHGLENEKKAISWKRVASSVTKGLMQLHNQNPTHHALAALNPHRIVFDNDTICIILNHPTQAGQLSNQNRQPQPLHPSIPQKSGPNEGERWEAPEVRKDEEQPKNECDQAKASVFSLGLVMFEMVTMTVPFGEVDGVNAHRQIVSGTLPDLSKIEDDSTRDLISSCLSFNPNERPSLTSLSDSLNDLAQTDPSTAALPSHNVVQ